MRLGTVHFEGRDRVVAALDDEALLDLRAAAEATKRDAVPFVSMLALIKAGETALAHARELVGIAPAGCILRMSDVSFRAPIMPVQYRDCLVFETHLKNSFAVAEQMTGHSFAIPEIWYDQPIYYKGNRFSFIGHEQDVEWPNYAEFLDIELELAIVVGKQGKNINADEAESYIFGYTVLNDVSARDAQMKEMPGQLGPAKGKDFDTGNILGPFILTADEVSHPVALEMEARVNGDRWGGGNSCEMHHDFGRILEHVSASETVYPGEVIGSGTVGTGCGLEIGKQLRPGDQFELEVEKIGTLRNRIVRN